MTGQPVNYIFFDDSRPDCYFRKADQFTHPAMHLEQIAREGGLYCSSR